MIYSKPTGDVFASQANTGESAEFPDVLRGWGITKEQTEGKPPMSWMNGAFKRIDENAEYLRQNGIPEWDEGLSYPTSAITKVGSDFYLSQAENIGQAPSTSNKWERLLLKSGDLDSRYLQVGNALSEFATAGAQANSRKNLGLKSAATYDVGTGSGQIPDMSSQQKGVGAGLGWQKLPSGLILQWGGTSPISGSGSSVNVTFPIEFPNAVVGVVFQSITEVSPSCAFFMHSDLTTASMKVWGVAKVIAAGATTAPLSAGISASWLVWGY